jgi:hypothetical protein
MAGLVPAIPTGRAQRIGMPGTTAGHDGVGYAAFCFAVISLRLMSVSAI